MAYFTTFTIINSLTTILLSKHGVNSELLTVNLPTPKHIFFRLVYNQVYCTGTTKNRNMHAVSSNQIVDTLHFTNNYRYLTSKTKDGYQALNEHTIKGFKKYAINTYYEQTKLTAALEVIKSSGHIKWSEPIKWSEIDFKEDTINFYKPIPMNEFEKGEIDKK